MADTPSPAKRLKGMIPFILLALALATQATHFDHWGATLLYPLRALASYLRMDILHSLAHVGLGTLCVTALLAILLLGSWYISKLPARFQPWYAGMLLMGQLWFSLNPLLFNRDWVRATVSVSQYTQLVPSAVTMALYAGLLTRYFMTLFILDSTTKREEWEGFRGFSLVAALLCAWGLAYHLDLVWAADIDNLDLSGLQRFGAAVLVLVLGAMQGLSILVAACSRTHRADLRELDTEPGPKEIRDPRR